MAFMLRLICVVFASTCNFVRYASFLGYKNELYHSLVGGEAGVVFVYSTRTFKISYR